MSGTPDRIVGHKEWTTRKSDPVYSMTWRRSEVASFTPGGIPDDALEDLMARFDEAFIPSPIPGDNGKLVSPRDLLMSAAADARETRRQLTGTAGDGTFGGDVRGTFDLVRGEQNADADRAIKLLDALRQLQRTGSDQQTQLLKRINELAAGGPVTRADLEAALRSVFGSLDGATPTPAG